MKRFLSLLLCLPLLSALLMGCGEKNPYPPIETVSLPAEEPRKEGTSGDYSYAVFSSYSGITGYSGKDTALTLPDKLGGYPVKMICEEAFAGNETIKSVVLPKSLLVIDRMAFENCRSLERVTFPEGLQTIGAYAFSRTALTSLSLPSTLYAIGREAFVGIAITSLVMPDSLTEADDYAFHACKNLKSVTLSHRLSELSGRLFEGCTALTEIVLPSTVTKLGDYVFAGCSSLTRAVIPSSVQTVGSGCFTASPTLTVILPEEGAVSKWCSRNAVTWRVAEEEEWASFYGEDG